MDNNFQGKYFSFFNIKQNQLQLIKFKSKDENFYSANTIWDKKIISNIVFKLYFNDREINQTEIKPVDESIEIIFLENFYLENEKIQFLVFNKEFTHFNFSFFVTDTNDQICFYKETDFSKTQAYKIFKLNTFHAGRYKINFYINQQYQYYCSFEIKKHDPAKYIVQSERIKNKLKLSLFPDDYKDDMKVRYLDLNNYCEDYDYMEIESEGELEELYVPLNELFDKDFKDNEFARFLKIKLEKKYNAMGIMKIIGTLKAMNTKEEVRFMENLIREDKELALTLIDIIFDFDLLFLIPAIELREILNIVDDYTICIALKGETKNRIEQIKGSISEKRWGMIEKSFYQDEMVDMDRTDKAQKKIGTVIRSYYQKKYGVPFVFEISKKTKYKIKNFKIDNNMELILPNFRYNGCYLIEFILKNRKKVKVIHKVSQKEEEYKFYLKAIYSTGDFFKIIHIDKEHVYLKFEKQTEKAVVLFVDKEIITMEELNKVYKDEIIQLMRPSALKFRFIIGTLDNESTIHEANFQIDLYQVKDNKIFIPDSILSHQKLPLKILNKDSCFLYIKQKEIPLSVDRNKWKDLLEIEKKENIEISETDNEIDIKEIEDTFELTSYVKNNLNCISFFNNNKEPLFFQNSTIILLPVIVRYMDNIIRCYNLTDKPVDMTIIQEEETVFQKKSDLHLVEWINPDIKKRLKVHVKSSVGEYTYNFPSIKEETGYNLKGQYNLQKQDTETILNSIYRLKNHTIFHLIAELKIYFFKYKASNNKNFKHLINLILDRIKKHHFRNTYFIYDRNSQFSILDVVEILLHLKEIYKAGLKQIDEMIEDNLNYLKKIKIKDKRLKDYIPKKKFRIF